MPEIHAEDQTHWIPRLDCIIKGREGGGEREGEGVEMGRLGGEGKGQGKGGDIIG